MNRLFCLLITLFFAWSALAKTDYSNQSHRHSVHATQSVRGTAVPNKNIKKISNATRLKSAFYELLLLPLGQYKLLLMMTLASLLGFQILNRRQRYATPVADNAVNDLDNESTGHVVSSFSKASKQRIQLKARKIFLTFHSALANNDWRTLEKVSTYHHIKELKAHLDDEPLDERATLDDEHVEAKLVSIKQQNHTLEVIVRFHVFIETVNEPTIEYIDSWRFSYSRTTNKLMIDSRHL